MYICVYMCMYIYLHIYNECTRATICAARHIQMTHEKRPIPMKRDLQKRPMHVKRDLNTWNETYLHETRLVYFVKETYIWVYTHFLIFFLYIPICAARHIQMTHVAHTHTTDMNYAIRSYLFVQICLSACELLVVRMFVTREASYAIHTDTQYVTITYIYIHFLDSFLPCHQRGELCIGLFCRSLFIGTGLFSWVISVWMRRT